MQTYQEFYQSISKPFFAPPGWAFGLAWGIIYPLIAIAFVYLVYLVLKKKAPGGLLWVFAINLAANFLFTPVQLGLKALWPASLDILVVLGTLLFLEYKVIRYSKLVFYLLLPYILWGAFATILQLLITFMN